MPLQHTDLTAVSRGGQNYSMQASVLLDYIQSNIGSNEIEVATIAARNALTSADVSLGDRVRVLDATGDATVNTGWAIYSYTNPGWLKIAEQEGIDVAGVASNLAYVASGAGGTVTNSNGSGFSLPLADGATNAGLMTPAQFTKLSNITISGAVNLDTIATKAHDPVTLAGNATNNPLTLNGQQLGFNIASLAVLP